MKKIFFIGLLIFSVFGIQAQEIKLGLKGGISYFENNNIYFYEYSGYGMEGVRSRTGFHFGFLAEFGITEKFSFQPEVLYSQKGAKNNGVTWKLDYLVIPVMAKYFVAKRLSLEAGPYIAFNLFSKMELDGKTSDFKDFTHPTDLGAGVGLGYELPMGVFIQGRLNLGFTKIVNFMDYMESAGKNNGLQLSLGYKF